MPIYEYDCHNCDKTLEAIQKVSEPPLRKCPRCGKESLMKKTSLNSFQLKGSGWYKDGYGGKAQSASTTTQSQQASKPSSKSPAA